MPGAPESFQKHITNILKKKNGKMYCNHEAIIKGYLTGIKNFKTIKHGITKTSVEDLEDKVWKSLRKQQKYRWKKFFFN